jgi:NAD(P)-dependent dehydrogenase (short-subunit alcohol dehydrogenase family)
VPDRLRILGIGDAKSRHFASWATRLAEQGHDVHVASSRVNPREGELDDLVVHHQFQELNPRAARAARPALPRTASRRKGSSTSAS